MPASPPSSFLDCSVRRFFNLRNLPSMPDRDHFVWRQASSGCLGRQSLEVSAGLIGRLVGGTAGGGGHFPPWVTCGNLILRLRARKSATDLLQNRPTAHRNPPICEDPRRVLGSAQRRQIYERGNFCGRIRRDCHAKAPAVWRYRNHFCEWSQFVDIKLFGDLCRPWGRDQIRTAVQWRNSFCLRTFDQAHHGTLCLSDIRRLRR